MLAIIEQWEEVAYSHTNNTGKYFLLLLFKFLLDAAVFFSFSKKSFSCLLSLFSPSLVIADLLVTALMATVWFLGSDDAFLTPCYILAKASAVYTSLPLPIMCLAFLDYFAVYDKAIKHTRCRLLWNVVLTLLVWLQAIFYAFRTIHVEPVEQVQTTGKRQMVCEVEESDLVTISNLGVFVLTICSLPPFWSKVLQWVGEADRIYELREEQENKMSDFPVSTWTHDSAKKSCEDKQPEMKSWQRPPLWFSLILCFLMFWAPYLVMFVGCLMYGLVVPAYISVNLLWLECVNSFLTGVVFWVKSKTQGPYSNLPENVCSWQIYWHLSKGTQECPLLPPTFNPQKGNKDNTFHV